MNFNPQVAMMPQQPMMGMQGAPQMMGQPTMAQPQMLSPQAQAQLAQAQMLQAQQAQMGQMGQPQMGQPTMMGYPGFQGQLPMAGAGAAGTTPITVSPQQPEGTGAMVPGMDPTTTASLGVAGLKPPGAAGTIMKSMAAFGAIGAVLGAGASFILPGGIVIGAAIGGALGAGIGLIRGLSQAKKQKEQFQTMMTQAGPAMLDPQSAMGDNPMISDKAKTARKVRKAKAARNADYTVKSGDTLSTIAARHKTTWKKIYDANRKVVGSNPARIAVGAKLDIPGDAKVAEKAADKAAAKKSRKKD